MGHLRKRNIEQVQTTGGPTKRPNTSNQRLRGQHGRGHCDKCRKKNEGVCPSRGMGCYKYGGIGHVRRDLPKGLSLICLYCNQVGNKKPIV